MLATREEHIRRKENGSREMKGGRGNRKAAALGKEK